MNLSEKSRHKWEISLTLRKKGAFQDAEKELKEALEAQPDHLLLLSSLAQLYLLQNRIGEARILAESILSREPEYPQALYVLGEIGLKENNLEDALGCFQQAAGRDSRPYFIHAVLKTLRKMGRYDEALETVDSLPVSQIENRLLLVEKALILEGMKLWDEALRTYERLKDLDPSDSYVTRSIYKLKGLKRPEGDVIRELQKVLQLPSRKDDAQLRGLLGEKLKKAGRIKEAAEEYKKARELSPENDFFIKQEGYCRYHLKDYQAALGLLGQAFIKNPADYILRSTLQKIYSALGDTEGFIRLLEEILKDQPNQVKLIGILKRLKKRQGTEGDRDR